MNSESELPEVGLELLDDPPPPERAAPRRRRLKVWLLLVVGVLVVVLGGAGFVFARVSQMLAAIERDPSMLPQPTAPSVPSESTAAGQPVDLVVMGSDSRGTDRGRSDVLMVVHLNATRDKVYLVSFPRDLYVPIPGHGENKINAAYAFGGSALTVQTLEELLGITVEHAAAIDFEGFVSLSEAVGGVTVWNRVVSSSGGFDFPRGDLELSGDKLLAYVRQRYGLPRGDLDRAERQRIVLKALIRKLATPEVLSNPVAFTKITGDLGGYLKVDAGLTDGAMWELASSLRVRGSSGVVTLQAPIAGFGTSPAGASIDIVDEEGMAELAQALREDTMERYVAASDATDED